VLLLLLLLLPAANRQFEFTVTVVHSTHYTRARTLALQKRKRRSDEAENVGTKYERISDRERNKKKNKKESKNLCCCC